MTSEATIEVEGVRKSFGVTVALAGLDLRADAGRVLALLGRDGAGKITLVRIPTTLLKPDAGHAQVAGFDVVLEAASVRPVTGLAGQAAVVDEWLTDWENLEFVGRLYHLRRAGRAAQAAEVLERLGLAGAADRIVKGYSGGMRRRLDLGASLLGRPEVLILDEPTTGLDPRTRNDLWHDIEGLVAEGTTALLTTQCLEEADYLARRIAVVDEGRVIAEGTSGQLKDQIGGDVQEARVARAEDLGRAGKVIARFGRGRPQFDSDLKRVSIPTGGGPSASSPRAECLRRRGSGLPASASVGHHSTTPSSHSPATEQAQAPSRGPPGGKPSRQEGAVHYGHDRPGGAGCRADDVGDGAQRHGGHHAAEPAADDPDAAAHRVQRGEAGRVRAAVPLPARRLDQGPGRQLRRLPHARHLRPGRLVRRRPHGRGWPPT